LYAITAVRDTLYVEKTTPGFSMPPQFDEATFDKIDKLAGQVDDIAFGMDVKPHGDIDFPIEIPKIRGGPLLTDIVTHMQYKRYCLDTPASKRSELSLMEC
jgi:hypothetical protein